MTDSALFTASELAQAVNGHWEGDPDLLPRQIGISTDTRQNGEGKIFFALSGENFDAHNFLDSAASSGCCALCIRKDFAGNIPALPCLKVDDVLSAFQQISAFHRRRFPQLTVAGITGSVGKTSTKEMIRAIFTSYTGDPEEVLYTIGNTNNHIGVPQNLLRLNAKHRFAVIEMGTSSPGEILPLSLIAAPAVAAVNTVAACHLEKLGSLDGVAEEKSTIFAGLSGSGKAVIGKNVHGENILRRAAGNNQIISFGTDPAACDIAATFEEGNLDESSFSLTFFNSRTYKIRWNLSGAHQAANAACAAAAAYSCGIPEEVIAAGLADTTLPGMRMKRTEIDGVTYINDAYNANPASMRALIGMLKKSDVVVEKLILCLGGMRELGQNSRAEHLALLDMVHTVFPGVRLITIGSEFDRLPGNGNCFSASAPAFEYLQSIVRPGDMVVAKGSRGNRVELALPEAAR